MKTAEQRDAQQRIRLLEQENKIPVGRRRTSPSPSPQTDLPACSEIAADRIPVAVVCRVLGFTKQAFYR